MQGSSTSLLVCHKHSGETVDSPNITGKKRKKDISKSLGQ